MGLRERPDGGLEAACRDQMRGWFGRSVDGWRHLRTDRIPWALPDPSPGRVGERPCDLGDGLFVAGDHCAHGSLEGAMVSGGRAAEAVLARLGGTAR